MALPTAIWLASAFILSLLPLLLLSKPQQALVLQRLGIKRQRASSRPSTPSLEKQPSSSSSSSSSSKPLASSSSDLHSTLPPSQRDVLRSLLPTFTPAQRKATGDLSFDEAACARALLALEEDYRTADAEKYCYSGFKVREIRALGDFPDYAALSGVPLPQPYKEFDIDRALPRPYRPFRWAYHQTMSLTKLEPDWWLELESTYRARLAQRQSLYATHGSSVLGSLPGSELACKELMEMCLQFLCARYPQYFSLSADCCVFENRILGTRTTVRSNSSSGGDGDGEQPAVKHPLLVLLEHVPEDFGIMLRDPESGYYLLRAGVVCSALGWNVGTKIGMKLHEIHDPIPDYKEKMQFSMDRFFSKLPTSKPIQRGSWGFEVDQPLFMPPGDPHEAHRHSQDPSLARSRVHLRVDWQTLRRLPLSGAVVFNFKALFTPLAQLRDEPYVPALARKVLRDAKPALMRYKNTWHTEHVVLPALEEYAREQVREGTAEDGWEPKTLDDSPWFPGWREKWHRQQGF
ncbi:hypothetical protein AAE478_007996 [Parahypoxylon ruwenzoriense]